MQKRFYFIIVVILVLLGVARAQDYTYETYSKKEGLAGVNAYSMVQDKEGFLWIGTETGLSRFDGSKFTNFTTLDGLPDNEVLNLFADSKGRVWIMSFRVKISYYYRGRVHNQENDSVLKKISLTNNVFNIAEDNAGNIFLQENGVFIHEIKRNGEVVKHTAPNGKVFRSIWNHKKEGIFVALNDNYSILDGGVLTKKFEIPGRFSHTHHLAMSERYFLYRPKLRTLESRSTKTLQNVISLPFSLDMIRLEFLKDSILVFCRQGGVDLLHIGAKDLKEHFLPGIAVNRFFIDNEGNYWFCTVNHGIFRLVSRFFKTQSFSNKEGLDIAIKVIEPIERGILVGGDHQNLYLLQIKDQKFVMEKEIRKYKISDSKSSISSLKYLPGKGLIFGSGDMIALLNAKFELTRYRENIVTKFIAVETDSTILLGTNQGIDRMSLSTFSRVARIWNSRPTCYYLQGDSIYIGGLEGLSLLNLKTGKVENLGSKFPALLNRVSAVNKTDDGRMWVAMYGTGLMCFDEKGNFMNFTQSNGLNTNVCKTIFAHKDVVWVTTDKGLSKIYKNGSDYAVLNLVSADGLPTDIINDVYVNDSLVFVASSRGITYFNESDLANNSVCNLRITGIKVDNIDYSYDTTNFKLNWNQNNIRFEYAGISIKSGQELSFQFRLVGLDSNWQSTTARFLSYPSLPSGLYKLQLLAVDRFGKKSEVKEIYFEIEKRITEKAWFRVFVFLAIIGFSAFLVSFIIKRIRRREKEKTLISERIGELEQMALRSQMNPHFIYNSLNSIQHYVIEKDIVGANGFISDFSRLVRLTLEYSSKSTIPIMDEIEYLRIFMKLEMSRLDGKFKFEVDVTQEIIDGNYFVPPMMVQPYIENSIRHGVRFRNDNLGLIKLTVKKAEEFIEIIVEDNGIGRKASLAFKATNPIEYQSKGMSLTEDRIYYFNRNRESKLSVQIEDLVDSSLFGVGTRVTLRIPDSI